MKQKKIIEYPFKLVIIKNKLYLINKATNEYYKLNIDYYKYGIIYNPKQVIELTILNSNFKDFCISNYIKKLKIINTNIDRFIINNKDMKLDEVYFINNKINDIIYKNTKIKVAKLISDIPTKIINKFDKNIINIKEFKEIEKRSDNYFIKIFKNLF